MTEILSPESEPPPPPPAPPTIAGPAWFFDRGPSLIRYVLRMWPTTLLPSLTLVMIASAIFAGLGLDVSKPGPSMEDFGSASPGAVFLLVIVIAPIIETLMLSFGIFVISLFTKRPLVIAVISAIIWGGMHAAAFAIQGIAATWSFFVFTCAYLAWRPVGWIHAYVVAMGIHMLQNLLPGLAILFVGQSPA